MLVAEALRVWVDVGVGASDGEMLPDAVPVTVGVLDAELPVESEAVGVDDDDAVFVAVPVADGGAPEGVAELEGASDCETVPVAVLEVDGGGGDIVAVPDEDGGAGEPDDVRVAEGGAGVPDGDGAASVRARERR